LAGIRMEWHDTTNDTHGRCREPPRKAPGTPREAGAAAHQPRTLRGKLAADSGDVGLLELVPGKTHESGVMVMGRSISRERERAGGRGVKLKRQSMQRSVSDTHSRLCSRSARHSDSRFRSSCRVKNNEFSHTEIRPPRSTEAPDKTSDAPRMTTAGSMRNET
jgi:hypothetical protein